MRLVNGVKIIGTGMYVPALCVENDSFKEFLDTSDEWIRTRTGIHSRHFSDGEPTWMMGEKAALKAIEAAGISPEEIDLILVTTVSSDYATPSIACMLQGKLGAKNAVGIDLNCACAAFVYALDMARRYLACGDMKTVLIVSSEKLSRLTNFEDRSSCVLFGDGAGAAVVTAGDGMFSSELVTDGTGAGHIFVRYPAADNPFCNPSPLKEYDGYEEYKDGAMYMNGKEVYKFATQVMADVIKKAALKAGVELSDLDLIVPHQANIRIIETAASKLGLPMEKFLINLDRFGNTSSATIPMALDEAVRDGRIKSGDKIAMAGFGAGLIAGAIVMEW